MAEQWLAIVEADRIHDFRLHELRLVKGGHIFTMPTRIGRWQ